MSSPSPIRPARLEWDERGEPRSAEFGDIYFSRGDGLAEVRHLFLANNGLPERWRGRRRFVVGETGFGTGLNFLATAALWRRHAGPGAALHYLSAEKYPLTRGDLARAHALWPELATWAAELQAQWPPPLPGFHRLHLADGTIALTLLFGDALEQFRQMEAQVDAWYLDGFAPHENEAMWSEPLFRELARLSAPAATLATFTVAGGVRRGLEAAGFTVAKVAGHGCKRQMLHGELTAAPPPGPDPAPWLAPAPPAAAGPAVVIGAGLAGAAVAHALARRGRPVTVIERRPGPAQEGSGNLAGLGMPLLTADWSPLGRWHTEGHRYTLAALAALRAAGHPIAGATGGILQIERDPKLAARLQAMLERLAPPAEVVRAVGIAEGTARAGLTGVALDHPGLHYPGGFWLHPPDLCRALLAVPGIELRCDRSALALERRANGWAVLDEGGDEVAAAATVVIAAGPDSRELAPCRGLPLHKNRGQVSHLPATARSASLAAGICYEGYLTPAHRGHHCCGASYARDDLDPAPRLADHAANLAQLAARLPALAEGVTAAGLAGRVSWRGVTADRLPLVGGVPDLAACRERYADLRLGRHPSRYPPTPYHGGLYLSAGHGSRGLVSCLLAAEALAALIAGEPWPVERELLTACHPGRFLVRELKKGGR